MWVEVADVFAAAEGTLPMDVFPAAAPIDNDALSFPDRHPGGFDYPSGTGGFGAKAAHLLSR